MSDNSQEMLAVAKRIATALETIAEQLAHFNDCMEECTKGDSIAVTLANEVRTRAS